MDELKNEIDEVDEIDENDDIPEQITPWPSVWSMDGHARFSCQHQHSSGVGQQYSMYTHRNTIGPAGTRIGNSTNGN